jgi:23S rRNA pseudouridine1911/1915/1917 synthase
MPKYFQIQADESAIGTRLDAFLAKALPELSRGRLQALIVQGDVTCASKTLRSSQKLKGDEVIDVHLPDPKPSAMLAQDIAIDILHEDDDIIVINKPAGLVVHPGAGNYDQTLVNALLHRFPGLAVGDTERPGLVHRLDKETSGVMVCARNDHAHRFLTEAFKSREVQKVYRAFCVGAFKNKKFELKTGHKRHPTDRKRFTTKVSPLQPVNPLAAMRGESMEYDDNGRIRLAHSKFEVLLSVSGVSELKVELLTGRTHQIRAHLADINHPLLHDALYGGVKAMQRLVPSDIREAAMALTRHALHAERLSFVHPTTEKQVEFVAPLPEDLQALHMALEKA